MLALLKLKTRWVYKLDALFSTGLNEDLVFFLNLLYADSYLGY